MGPPGGSRPDFNGTRPDFNGTRPDYNGTRPNGPDGDRARSGGRFGLPVDRLLSSVSSACVAAANSTTAFDVCRPDNSTIAANLTHKDTECSSACTTAVQGYWSTVVAACGSESLVEVVPRNTSIAAFNLTAADLEPIALLELAVGCTKDLSGNWCQGARGGRGGRGGRGPRPDGNRNGTDMAPPRGGNGTENAKGQRGMRGPGGRMPGNDQGRPAFNATICAEVRVYLLPRLFFDDRF